jgi:peptidoglycan/xylan/chitin deacetylase (PgdA/CDA1 family)
VENKVLILCYHHVAKTTGDNPMKKYYVDPPVFRAQMKFLKDRGFNVTSLSDILEAFSSKKGMPPKTVAITFDDGYRSFLTAAFPALKELGFPSAVFVPTGRVGKANDWDDVTREDSDIMSLDEMKALAADGVSFHSHGESHPRLAGMDEILVRGELEGSKEFLSEHLGSKSAMFSYPFSSVDEKAAKIAASAGYACALTADFGANLSSGDPFRMRRVQIFREDSVLKFALKLYYAGFFGETAKP